MVGAADNECERPSFPPAFGIMNASGPRCSTIEELGELAKSNSVAVLMKSCTAAPRQGNAEPRWSNLDFGGIQCMGLPNLGYEYYIDAADELRKNGTVKPIVMSVSGLCLQDNIQILKPALRSECDAIELNVSCPNIVGKAQVGYDFEQMKEVLDKVAEVEGVSLKPFGLKLPPYFDDCHYESIAKIINSYSFIKFVTTINSVGNCLVIDKETDKPVIRPNMGRGGLCGEYVKPVGLANVLKLRQLLRSDINIIGVGGIATGRDVYEYFLVGANAVQIGATFEKEGCEVFDRLKEELNAEMKRKGVEELNEISSRFALLP